MGIDHHIALLLNDAEVGKQLGPRNVVWCEAWHSFS